MNRTLRATAASILTLTIVFFGFESANAEPIEIGNWHDLHNIRNNMATGTVYVLVNDLDETTAGYSDYNTGAGWEPIGTGPGPDAFAGTLDGRGYAIKGLTMNTDQEPAGLFGQVHSATIKDLKILDANITTSAGNVGILAGMLYQSDVENVTVSGTINATGITSNLGGLIGRQEGGRVLKCASYVDLNVEGRMVGGISGTTTFQAEVGQSYFKGNITTDVHDTLSMWNRWIGGITGQFGGLSMITDSYVTGDVSGTHTIGGLVGYHWRGGSLVTNSYFVGTVAGNPASAPRDDDDNPILNVGGITGFSDPPQNGGASTSQLISTYWNTEVSGVDISFGGGAYPTDHIGEGKTSAEMRTQATFIDWDFTDVWAIDPDLNDGYPYLKFAYPADDDDPVVIDAQWEFQNTLPEDASIGGFHGGFHGVAFDMNGNIWGGPYFSIMLEEVERINPVYCFKPDGTFCDDVPFIYGTMTADTLLRFGPIRGMATDHEGNILISTLGYRVSDEHNEWNTSRAFVHRIDPNTGDGLGVGEITEMRTLTASYNFHIATDKFGNIYYSSVFPGQPIRVMDSDFNFLRNVSDNRLGFARAIAVNREGTRVYQPSNYETELTTGDDTEWVRGRVEIHGGNIIDGFTVLDTMSVIGMDPGAAAVCPQTGIAYFSASGVGSSPEGDPDRWEPLTIYGLDIRDDGTIHVVDELAWHQADPASPFNPVYRGLAIAEDGYSLAVGGFERWAPIQYFTRKDMPDPIDPVDPVDPDDPAALSLLPQEQWVTLDSLYVVDVYVGSYDNPVLDLHGIGFQIHQSEPNFELEEILWGDFMGDAADVIVFEEIHHSGESVDLSITRKSASGISGHGKLVSLVYRSVEHFENTHAFRFDEVLAVDATGEMIELTTAELEILFNTTVVWPGDTNHDGIVDMQDILPIGQYYGMSGPARAAFNVSWSGQVAGLWEVPEATSADATGDGKINQNDILPIGLNFGKIRPGHTNKPVLAKNAPLSDTDMLFLDVDEMMPGDILHIVLEADETAMPQEGILGLAGLISTDLASLPKLVIEIMPEFGEIEDLLFFIHQYEDEPAMALAVSRKRQQGMFKSSGILEIELLATERIAPFRLNFEDFKASSQSDIIPADFLKIHATVITSSEFEETVTEYALKQNYPNPFNPSTNIRFALPEQSDVTLVVYNLLGQRVATLVNETRPAGWHEVTFDASRLASGVFIYRLEAEGYVETKSMILVK